MAAPRRPTTEPLPPRPERPFTVVSARRRQRVILVDGANVAHEMHRNDQPQIANLWRVERALQKLGYDPLLIIDANLRWKLSREDAVALERRRDEIVQAPAGIPADRALLEYASRKGVSIVTNDRFRDYEEEYPWIRDVGRRVPYNIIGDEVLLYFPRPRAAPPSPQRRVAAPRPKRTARRTPRAVATRTRTRGTGAPRTKGRRGTPIGPTPTATDVAVDANWPAKG